MVLLQSNVSCASSCAHLSLEVRTWVSGFTGNIQHSFADNPCALAVNLSCWQLLLFIHQTDCRFLECVPASRTWDGQLQKTELEQISAPKAHWAKRSNAALTLSKTGAALSFSREESPPTFWFCVPRLWNSFRKRARVWGSGVSPLSELAWVLQLRACRNSPWQQVSYSQMFT